MATILLKDGQVGCGLGVYDADVLIEDGKIVSTFDWGKEIKADKVIDCKGKLILPGLIDAHVHMREPGQSYKEDWETGSKAAVAGGITTVFDMPNNQPPVLTVKDLDAKRALISGRSYCNYGLFIGFDGKNISEINKAKNIAGVKVFAANSTGNMGVAGDAIEKLFRKCNKTIVVHAEDEVCIAENTEKYLAEFDGREIDPSIHSKIRSPECAAKAVKFVCELAKKSGHKLHVAHVSSDQEIAVILEYRDSGVTCEVSPHHLLLSEDDYGQLNNFIKVNPPVRSRTNVFGMWKALKFGEIDIVATDHAPHTFVEKQQGYMQAPSGMPELETLLPIMLNAVNSEGLEVKELVKLCCEGPAKLFGAKFKGQIEAGFDADIVVVDMDMEREVKNEELFTKCGWSPYHGSVFKGWPIMTFVGGELVFKDGKVVGKKMGKEVEFGG